MADQYTRITCGGSPLPRTSPVVGLLFGSSDAVIQDADDVPVEAILSNGRTTAAAQVVQLYQAVFPNQHVIGWYKVVQSNNAQNPAEPSVQDVQTTIQLAQHYAPEHPERFLFALLQVEDDESNNTDTKQPSMETTKVDPVDSDDDLPLVLYHCQEKALVALPRWTLATEVAEKVAVERVVREVPINKDDGTMHAPMLTASADWLESLTHIQVRVQVLMDYLQATQSKTIPYNAELLRRVQAVFLQLGPLAGNAPPDDYNSEHCARDLAILGQAVSAVQRYAEGCQAINESHSNTTSSSSIKRATESLAAAAAAERRFHHHQQQQQQQQHAAIL